MTEKSEKKLITESYSVNTNFPKVNFQVDRFEAAILQKGYNVYHHRALRCPCLNKDTGTALPSCENCTGIGWFYIEKTKTKALVQNLGNNKKFESWSETNSGTCQITTLYQDDITYMDKFELIDLEVNFSQVLFPKVYRETLFAFTIYEPIEMMNIYQFLKSGEPLQPLFSKTEKPTDWDYYIDKNKIIFNLAKFDTNTEISISVRYKHIPVYCVIDIVREVFKTQDKGCSVSCEEDKDLGLRGMPQKSIGRRLHYIWNANNFSGPAEFDNTEYGKLPPNKIVQIP